MNGQEKLAAWLGLFALVAGAFMFVTFVAPRLIEEYRRG